METESSVQVLARQGALLVQRLRLWTPARFDAVELRSGASRGRLVHHLAQMLADAAAALEGTPRRALPWLDSQLGLPDQLAVTCDDVARAGPAEPQARLLTAHLLAHRHDLLGDEVPPALAALIGLDDVVSTGQAQCRGVPR